MANNTTTIKFVGQFDSSGITKGLQEIKKQITSSNISEELKKQLQDSFNKVEVNLPKLEKFMKKEDFNLKELNEYQKLVQEITKDMTNFSKIANEADFTKNFSEQDTARLKKFDEQIKQVDEKLKATKREIINTFSNTDKGKINGKSNDSLNGIINQLLDVPEDQIENKLNEIIKEAENQTENARIKLQEVFQNSSRGKNLKGQGIIDLLFGKNSGVTLSSAASGKLTTEGGVYDQFDKIRNSILSFTKDTPVEEVEKTLKSLSGFVTEFFNVPEGKEPIFGTLLPKEVIDRIKTLATDIPGLKAALGKDNLKLLADGEAEKIRLTQQQAEELKKTIEGLAEKGVITRTEADNLVKKFTGLSGVINDNADAAKHLDNQHKALNATFGTLARRIENSVSALTIFNKSIQIVRKAVDSVKELDAAFTQIAIVSEQSNEQAWQMFDSFNKLAKQYSITTKDLTEGAKLFYQQGLSAADTMKMVEASTISAALGEVTMTEAANTLTAAIQGYNESAEVAMAYTDKIAMVGAVSAADFNELSAAMEKTASSAYTAGIDFDHLLGYLGKMIEVTREAPANLGTAMKTIIARFEDMKKDPNALIDGASANKVEAALATIGIALRDTAGEFRPLQDVFDELGMKWESLTRNQQAYIATVAAGSRQQSRFLAMMNNYDRTLDLITESQNSAGAALKQYETYQDSAAAATARLTAAWEEFYAKVADSDLIITVIDALTKLVETMSKIGPAWSAVIATIGAHTVNKIIKGQALSKFLSSFFTISVPQLTEKGIMEPVAYSVKEGISIGIQKWIAEKTGKNVLKNGMQIATAEGVTAGIGTALKSGFTALAPFLGIATMIVGTFLILVQLGKAAENNAKKYEDLYKYEGKINKEFIEQTDKIKEQKNNIKDNLKIYEEYENKIVLTNEELQEQNKAVDILEENNENLIVIIDELGKKHITNKEILEEQTKELEKQEKISNQIIASNKLNAVKKDNLQDLSVEQLINSGYTQDEAELLNKYGDEIFKYRNNDTAWYKPNFTPDQNLAGDIKKEMSKNKIAGIVGLDPFYIQEILQSGELDKISSLIEKLKISLSLSDNEQLNNVLNFIIEKAELAKDGVELLNKTTQNYIKSVLSLNSEFVIGDSFLQNSFSNLFNNLDVFNNGDYFKQFENMTEDQINDEIDKIIKDIQENIDTLGPYGQKKFNEFSKKLLDPTLSPNQKQNLLNEFENQVGEITGELQNIVDQYIAGSNIDIARRKKLSENLNITEKDLNKFNSRQLQIIDQFRTANKNTVGPDSFDVGAFVLTDTGSQLLKSLSTLEHDITNDPSIYTKAQEVMVKFFEDNFSLDKTEAYNTFQAMFGDIPEAAMEAAADTFNNAKDLMLSDPTKALTKKQSEAYQELESLLGDSLSLYISINEEGEEYLSIAGRIAVFEKASQKYENTILAEIGEKRAQQDQIKAVNEKLTKENEKQINQLEKEIEINKEKLRILKETREYAARNTAASANIARANTYSDNLKAIKQAEDEMKKFNGVMNNDTADTIIKMGVTYSKYLDKKLVGDHYYYTISKENLQKLKEQERENYNAWIQEQNDKLDKQITILSAELSYFQSVVDAEGDLSKISTQEEFDNKVKGLDDKLLAAETELEAEADLEKDKNEEIVKGAENASTDFYNEWHASYTALRQEWDQLAEAMNAGEPTSGAAPTLIKPNRGNNSSANNPTDLNTTKKPSEQNYSLDEEPVDQNAKNKQLAQEQVDRINAVLDRLKAAQSELVPLGPELEDVSKGAGKTNDEMKKLTKTLEKLTDALEDLDKLLLETKRDLADIEVDYSPFMELFEAWEHEWDYYYNIKNLIAQLGQQGEWIDNIISSEYASATNKLEAYDAKVGNITAKMAANDAYILTLRQGIAQNALELEKKFGQYYNVDNVMGSWQIYQKDTNLKEWNDTANAIKKASYELNKFINQEQNELNLLEANQEALEQERSAYESILSTVESLIDSLEDDEDITVDLSELKDVKAELELSIKNESIEEIKQQIHDLNDYIQELEWQLDLNDNVLLSGIDDAVEDMEELRDKIQEYIDTLNETITQQQELLGQLVEVYNYYIDTAISTEQELYNAIVENYQNEIDQKKKQYDYLKQLDNDYLNSIKKNISEERKAREDANKQKSYQQNLQRAQLLSMDTSGAYRKELANLNKEIEGQRQDLYDDLVDKQVEALEKEIEKRHELYDMELNALEERLAYMQENAILLWEMVNQIVADGSEAMMATLENTMDYINSNELSKERQRKQWELSIQTTFKGIVDGEIENLKVRIEKGNEYIKSIEEIKSALEANTETYIQSTTLLIEENANFQTAMDAYMQVWTDMTHDMTGYHQEWQQTVNQVKLALEKDIEELMALGEDGGGIKELEEKLRQSAKDMYDSFIEERRSYKDQLTGIINEIETQITAAIQSAADAIRNAANSLQVNSNKDSEGTTSSSGGIDNKFDSTLEPNRSNGGNVKGNLKGWKASFNLGNGMPAYHMEQVVSEDNTASYDQVYQDWLQYLNRMRKNYPNMTSWGLEYYKQGGFADFTGPAWLDGTKSQPEAVLNPKQTRLFTSMVSSLEKASNNSNINSDFGSSYNIGNINTSINVAKLDNQTDIDKVAKAVENKIVNTIRNRVPVSINKGV